MSIINEAATKRLILDAAKRMRCHPWERVSMTEWTPYLQGRIVTIIEDAVHSAPSKGKTLYPPIRAGEST